MNLDLDKLDLSKLDPSMREQILRLAKQQLAERTGDDGSPNPHEMKLDSLKWPDLKEQHRRVLDSTNHYGGRILPVDNDPLRRTAE